MVVISINGTTNVQNEKKQQPLQLITQRYNNNNNNKNNINTDKRPYYILNYLSTATVK